MKSLTSLPQITFEELINTFEEDAGRVRKNYREKYGNLKLEQMFSAKIYDVISEWLINIKNEKTSSGVGKIVSGEGPFFEVDGKEMWAFYGRKKEKAIYYDSPAIQTMAAKLYWEAAANQLITKQEKEILAPIYLCGIHQYRSNGLSEKLDEYFISQDKIPKKRIEVIGEGYTNVVENKIRSGHTLMEIIKSGTEIPRDLKANVSSEVIQKMQRILSEVSVPFETNHKFSHAYCDIISHFKYFAGD